MPKVACYYRVSSKGQEDRGTIENQRFDCRKKCTQEDYTVVAEFEDPAVSGNSLIDSRPDGSRLMTLLRSGEIQGIVAVHLDRLTRSDSNQERGMILDELKSANAFLDCTNSSKLDFTQEDAELIGSMEGYMSAKWLREHKKKVRSGIARARRENRYSGGELPYGISWENQEWVVAEQEYQTLRKAIELIRQGNTIQNVVDLFNRDLRRYPAKKTKWTHGSLWRMLCRTDFLFTGCFSDGLETGIRLFTEQEIQEVRHLVKLNRRGQGGGGKPRMETVDFLLKRLARCECGWYLSTIFSNGKDRYYRCKRCCCGVKADELDNMVWTKFVEEVTDKDRLLEAVKSGSYAVSTEDTRQATADLARAEQIMEAVRKRKKMIMRLLSDPNSALNHDEVKTTMASLLEKSREAESLKQEAHLRLSKPDMVEKAVEAAIRSVSRQLDKITEIVAKFYSHREARQAGISAVDVLKEVREQKRAILKSAISSGDGIVVKANGEARLNGSILLPVEFTKLSRRLFGEGKFFFFL